MSDKLKWYLSPFKGSSTPNFNCHSFFILQGTRSPLDKDCYTVLFFTYSKNVFMLADYYETYREKSATLLMSPVFSAITVPAILYFTLTYV